MSHQRVVNVLDNVLKIEVLRTLAESPDAHQATTMNNAFVELDKSLAAVSKPNEARLKTTKGERIAMAISSHVKFATRLTLDLLEASMSKPEGDQGFEDKKKLAIESLTIFQQAKHAGSPQWCTNHTTCHKATGICIELWARMPSLIALSKGSVIQSDARSTYDMLTAD